MVSTSIGLRKAAVATAVSRRMRVERAQGAFPPRLSGGGVNSKKNAAGALYARLCAIPDDGSQTMCDLSFCFFHKIK